MEDTTVASQRRNFAPGDLGTYVALGSATAPMSIRLQGGNVVIIAAALNKFPYSLVARKEIRQPSQLVGKKIGIVNFGGSNDLALTLALKEWASRGKPLP